MAPKTTKKRKTEKAPAVDKLLIPAIGIAAALMGYQFFTGLTSSSNIERVDPNDDVLLREIFFGEVSGKDSYAVLCSKEEETHVSSVFSDASSGGSPALFRLLDCNYVLPESEKSIADRFKLNMKKRPTIFLSGAVGEPKQIPEKHLKTGAMLTKALKGKLEPRAVKIETTQELRAKCLNQPHCALLMKGSSKPVDSKLKKAIQQLVVEQPKVVFASIDTSSLYVKNAEEHLPMLQKGKHRFVVFKKVSGDSSNPKEGRLITSMASLPDDRSISYGPLSNMVANVLSGGEEMKKLSSLPMIKTRTKKLEAEEKARRERKTQQKNNAGKDTPAGMFAENDGSADGRRAERERRRQEHYAKTGAKPKTPEEIAEMERQRRLRMEEAENAWTVQDGDEDAAGGGDYMMEEEDDSETFVEDVDDEEEDDDEDVMDLD